MGGTVNEIATISSLEWVFGRIVGVLLGFVGIALFMMLIAGGFKLMTSGGDPKAKESAQKTITFAVLGVVLAALALLILLFISEFTGIDVTVFNITI